MDQTRKYTMSKTAFAVKPLHRTLIASQEDGSLTFSVRNGFFNISFTVTTHEGLHNEICDALAGTSYTMQDSH
ncbi:hypothetical protein [Rhodococcus qingshengii]|uniref:hypothetical protein n=1 Tax=Rhodococcus qingshengii TaxID=334542 RepID=UPI0035E197B7